MEVSRLRTSIIDVVLQKMNPCITRAGFKGLQGIALARTGREVGAILKFFEILLCGV
jgi:hypothetical protein